MASTTDSSAAESSMNTQKSAAQILAEQHAVADHHPTVEEEVDEEDIAHPPPSTLSKSDGTNGILSDKAAGKRKADDKSSVLDTQDEQAFPTLGSTSKPTAVAPGWGAKGSLKTGTSTPSTPGTNTPTSNASRQTQAPHRGAVNLPGRGRDHFDIEIADIDKEKSIEKVIQDVKRKYRVNAGVGETGNTKTRRIYAEGPQQSAVRQALMDISKAISVEQRLTISVPATVSASIIGKSGANIRKLEQDHGVKIQIQRDQRPPSTNPDESRVDVVEVRGDAAATRVVHQKITDLVKQLQPKVDMPLRGIPPEFYPFLAGRHADQIQRLEQENDLQIKIPQYNTWQKQPPSRPAQQDASLSFAPHGDSHVIVSGDQAAVMQARVAIEQLAEQLQRELLLEELTCEQVLHPYVFGERGMNPQEFLEQTGCAIILPPQHHETDDIHLIGPADRLEAGRNLAEQLMSQKHNRPIDLQKQFSDAPMGADRHSRALAQYLQEKALEREFTNAHSAEVVFPYQRSGAPTWTVVTSDSQKAVAAKNDLMKIAQAYPTPRLQLVEVDPFFHPHLGKLHSQRMKNDHGVHMIVPKSDQDAVILVYEGPAPDGPFTFPRQRPTNPELKEFQRALQEAQAQLLGSIPQTPVQTENVDIPRKFHDRVRRFVKTEHTPQASTAFPVQVDFGAPRTSRSADRTTSNPDAVFLRGPNPDEIAELRQKILEFMIEAEQDEKERGYTTTVNFPEKFVKNLVGKNGANIKALREKHDVEIDAREAGVVKIQGPQKKAEACKAEIVKIGKQFEDEVSYSIKVDPKFHGELIGKSGENLHRLQDKVNKEVRIDFPRAQKSNDNQSMNDAASEAGGPQIRQAADEIKIRGPRAKADKVRDELLSLAQYLQDNSYSSTVSVAKDQIASLIGRGGIEMDKLRSETGAQIDIPNKAGEGDGSRVTLTIKGPKQAVDKAKAEIQKRSKAHDAVVTKTISVDKKHHRTLIGGSGANIKRIVLEAGGPAESAEAVRFPKQDEESHDLTVKGTEDVVEKIIAAIEAYVNEKENQVSEIVEVPQDQHRHLIGPNGSIRKSIEQQFSINLDVPRRESGKTGIKVSGQPSNVAKAREHILGLTKQPEGVIIMVPRALHHTVSNDGRIFRDLSRQGIKVDHKGQKPPPKSQSNGVARSPPTNGDMPLITDDQQDGQAYSFDIVALNDPSSTTNGDSGEIPWVLIGNKDATEESIAKARKNLEDAIASAQEPKHVGYLRLSDPRLHRHVVGQRGATINSIRKKTGCDIQVPGGAKAGPEEEITITGREDGIMTARDLILEEIKRATL